MGQFTGVSLTLLPPKKNVQLHRRFWLNLLTFRGVIMRVRHRLSRTKWVPVQRKRRRSHDIGINSKRNGLRS